MWYQKQGSILECGINIILLLSLYRFTIHFIYSFLCHLHSEWWVGWLSAPETEMVNINQPDSFKVVVL